jgi:hypothetical protein
MKELKVGQRVKFTKGPWVGRVGEVVRDWESGEYSVRIDPDDPSGPTMVGHRDALRKLPDLSSKKSQKFEKKVVKEGQSSLVEMVWGRLDEVDCQAPNVELDKVRRDPELKNKKFSVCVKDGDSIKKVSFGDPDMKIRKSDDAARKSFRARHGCDDPGPKTKARYWACKTWEKDFDLP